MNVQSKNHWAPWRATGRKAFLVLVVLLLSVVVFSAVVQADDVSDRERESDVLEPVIVSETQGPEGTDVVITLYAAQDAFISSANPDTTYGLWDTVRLGYEQANANALRGMVQWNLNPIPPNVVINNATMSVYQYSVTPPGDTLAVQGQYITQPWNETTVTWHNANYLGGDITQIGEIDGSSGWKSFNVTDLVRSWYSGHRPNYGHIFTADERPTVNRYRSFWSRQKPGFVPFLTVDYTQACDNLPPTASINPLPTFVASSYTVTWGGTDNAPSGCTPSGIDHYDVQYRKNGGSWVTWRAQVTITSDTFSGAQNGAFYEFRARAVDKAGNVQAWTGTQASTTADTVPPVATVNPLPEYTHANNFILTWGGSDNMSGIKNYDVQYKIGDGPWLGAGFNPTTMTSFHVTGLQSGTTYYFRARATDNVGNTQSWPAGAQASTTVVLEPASEILPFNPPILKPTAPITDSFTVRWQGFTAPGTSITSFAIFYQYNEGAWQLWDNFTGSETSASFPYLSMGMGDGRYGFEAVATNSVGQTETRKFEPEEIMIVDLADAIQPDQWMPLIVNDRIIN